MRPFALGCFRVARIPGWDMEWSESNVSLLMTAGRKGRRGPVKLTDVSDPVTAISHNPADGSGTCASQ
jgi:hypothetical protein